MLSTHTINVSLSLPNLYKYVYFVLSGIFIQCYVMLYYNEQKRYYDTIS